MLILISTESFYTSKNHVEMEKYKQKQNHFFHRLSIKHSINPINRLYRRPHPYHGPRVPDSPKNSDSGNMTQEV